MADQPSRRKLILMIIGFVAVVVGIGYLLYITFFRAPVVTPPVSDVTPPADVPAGIGLPTASEVGPIAVQQLEGEGLTLSDKIEIQEALQDTVLVPDQVTETARGGFTRVEQLTTSPVRVPTLSSDRNGLHLYDPGQNKFYRLDEFGNVRALSDQEFFNVADVAWSPAKSEGIIEFPDGANIFYDFENETQVTLPIHWEEFSFGPTGDQIAFESYTATSPENNWLAVARPDGSQPRLIEPIGERGQYLETTFSPNNQVIGLLREPIASERQEIYFLGQNNENFPLTVVEGYNFKHQWEPEGKQLLYSVANSLDEYKPRLWIVNSQGNRIGTDRQKLPIMTFADRCTFTSDGSSIYCAEPIDPPKYSGYLPVILQNQGDSNSAVGNVPSMIIRYDVNTRQKEILAIPDEVTDITQVFINENEDTLFYTDNEAGTIRKIKL